MGAQERLIKRLILTTVDRCGACGRHYEIGDITILGRQEEVWFLSLVCSQCHTQGLVAALIKEQKPPQIVTDLTGEEMKRLSRTPKITADDVLDMHQFLKDFQGNFSTLFRNHKEDGG